MTRRSGILVPLFSLRSTRSWGIGEFLDLPSFARWLGRARQAFLQILPITTIHGAETSPYSAQTAMGLDPAFITVPEVEDFAALGGEAALPSEDRTLLESVRAADRIRYQDVRALKTRWLRRAWEQFQRTELRASTPRAAALAAFVHEQRTWLDDLTLFEALSSRYERQPWWEWPAPLARRDPAALAAAREELAGEIAYREYVQWVAASQWTRARAEARPVGVFGDVPFMISADSADVWARQAEFRFDGTVGVPPDAFSDTGQDWGLPPWRWEVMAENGFEWMRQRAARTAALFDGFRLDHLVGLYRTYVRPFAAAAEPFFAPPDEPTQLRLGERLVSLYQETGAEIIAEDLGTVPDFVRASLRRLGVPGYKVLRWERRWTEPGQPYIDPSEYEEMSVATTGTHDTESLVAWWTSLPPDEQRAILDMPSVRRHASASSSPLDCVLHALLDAPSRLAIVPLQDVFGWRDRINTPAAVSEENWSWLVPWPVDTWLEVPEAVSRAEALARWTAEARRSLDGHKD